MHGRANASSELTHALHLETSVSNAHETPNNEMDPTGMNTSASETECIRGTSDLNPPVLQGDNPPFELENTTVNTDLNKCSSPLKGNGCDSTPISVNCSFPSRIPTPAYSDMMGGNNTFSHSRKENRSNQLYSSKSSSHINASRHHSPSSVSSSQRAPSQSQRRPRSVSCNIIYGREQLSSVPYRKFLSSCSPLASLIPRYDYSDLLFSSTSSQGIVFNDLTLQ